MKILLPNQYESVANVVCGHFAVSRKELKSKLRTDRIATTRHVIWYLLKTIACPNMSEIARCSESDPGAIRHGITRAADLISVDSDFAMTVAMLEGRCRILLEVNQ
jgi:chromosomal replication initiation ATPase DnaA